ncbi:MAG: HEAT repeat domain-containing protein [Candidatus Riflebacteria bacterium]|nr:HEAT repeat domain-containing protein [Candidatus Riflebacteria bacterium]
MSKLSPILNNLDANDLAVRLFTILRLQELTGKQVIPEKLKQAAESETDPALKLYLNWLAYPEIAGKDADLASLSELLKEKSPDWPQILRLLLQANRQSAAPVLEILREASLNSLPPSLLPVLVGFYSRFGDNQDISRLESWCSHPNPAATILAVEGLSRIQPDKLKDFLYPLLTSESAGIRSRAIRLLYRWHPQEALSQMSNMLDSDVVDERRAALAHAFFLPFDRIKDDLLRFMRKEEMPALLIQAGQLLIINPDIEVAKAMASVAAETSAEKAPIISNILAQQCEFLARLNLIELEPCEQAAHLIKEAQTANEQKRMASLTQAIQAGILQNQYIENLPQAAAWLKNRFSVALPIQTLLPVVEGLAVIEPVFLLPHMSELLQIQDIKVQMAALSAMAIAAPVQAEKLIEQYLCSATPARRRTGINVLARLDKTFAQPLLLRTLAQETEQELLELIETLLSDPLPRDTLVSLLGSAKQAEENSGRLALITRLCEKANQKFTEINLACNTNSGFSNEEIMLGRAEKQITAGQSVEQPETGKIESRSPEADKKESELVRNYQRSRPVARITLILNILQQQIFASEDLISLLHEETGVVQSFAIQVAIRAGELKKQKSCSPAQLLKQNLAQRIPVWVDIATALVMMSDQSVKLSAPILQQRRWSSWPETTFPFMLHFIGKTARPQFSAQVSKLLHHSRPEIRYFALSCLLAINPGELPEHLPELHNDEDGEVAELARNATRQIQAHPQRSLGSLSGKLFQFVAGLVNGWQNLTLLTQTAISAGIIVFLALCLIFTRQEETLSQREAVAKAPTTAGKSDITTHRFEHWHQPAEAGQVRVVFGRIEENYSDSLLIQSPALHKQLLIRHGKGVLPLRKNQHFNGKVKIDMVGVDRIESTLIENRENR